MTHGKTWLAGAILGLALLTAEGTTRAGDVAGTADPAVFAVFVGSTPCTDTIKPILQITADADSPIRWNLTLRQDPKTTKPTTYQVRCVYKIKAAGSAGAEKETSFEKSGAWKIEKGTKSNPAAIVYDLEGLASFAAIDRNIAHVLNPDGSLMVGNAGFSYTLNRTDSAEKPGNLALALAKPSTSYSMLPRVSGPPVFGIFEGRTPAIGIARELKIPIDDSWIKSKWRITLLQDPKTRAPTTYKVEGSLHRQSHREGTWSIIRGASTDPDATVYRLEATDTEAALLLLKGDDNVLFFLNGTGGPLVGHAEFSYTLNRSNPADANPEPAE